MRIHLMHCYTKNMDHKVWAPEVSRESLCNLLHKYRITKSFCTAEENSIKMKREPSIYENIFANDTSDQGLSSKIY